MIKGKDQPDIVTRESLSDATLAATKRRNEGTRRTANYRPEKGVATSSTDHDIQMHMP